MDSKILYRDDLERAGILPARKFAGVFGRAAKKGMAWWHEKKLARHFTRGAYSLYPGAYPKPKRKGLPLVKSGTLRRRILSSRQRQNIRGTAKRTTLIMRYGRPRQFTKKLLEEAILVRMGLENLSWQQAANKVYAQAGYGERNRQIFQDAITATTNAEATEIAEKVRDFYYEEAERMATAKSKVIR